MSAGDNLPRRRFGAGGTILSEVLPGKEDGGTPFQDAVINTSMGETRRVLDLVQLQIGGDNQGLAASVTAVDDGEHLFQSILGATLYPQVVDNQKVICCNRSSLAS